MRAADEAEYEEFLRARMSRWHRSAYLMCGDPDLADDLVQATALRLYRKWRIARAADNLDAYVYRMLANEFFGEKRRPWARVLLGARAVERAAPAAASVEERDAVRAALAELGPRQRAVLVLRFFCDLSVEQTAQALDCAPGTVKSQTARGLATLRQRLAGTPEPDSISTGGESR